MASSALGPAPVSRYTTEVVRPLVRPAQAPDQDGAAAERSVAMLDAIDAFGIPVRDDPAALRTRSPAQASAPAQRLETPVRHVVGKLETALRLIDEQYLAAYAADATLGARVANFQQQLGRLRADSENDQLPAGVILRLRELAQGIQDLGNDVQQLELRYLVRIQLAAQAARQQQVRTTSMHCFLGGGTIAVDAFVRATLINLNWSTTHTTLLAAYRHLALPGQVRVIAELLRTSIEARQAGVRLADIQQQLLLLLNDEQNRLNIGAGLREYLLEATRYGKQRQVEGLLRMAREISCIAQIDRIPDLPVLVQAIQNEQVTTIRTFCERYERDVLADALADRGDQIALAVRILLYEYGSDPCMNALMTAISQRWMIGAAPGPAFLPRDTTALRGLLIDPSRSLSALVHAYANDHETIPILLIYLAHEHGS